jgi:putative DNA primase/helicase
MQTTVAASDLKRDLRAEAFNDVMAKIKFVTLENTLELFMYESGIYVSNGKPERIISEVVRQKLLDLCTKQDVIEVIARIKDATYVNPDFFENQSPEFICVTNGVLNLLTGNLEPFNPNFHFRNKIGIPYEVPEAGREWCVKTGKFFREIVEDGTPDVSGNVTEQKINALFEFFGYCLFPDHPIHKAFLLIGDGSNGKTTLLNLLNVFLGRENISNIDLQSICQDRFACAEVRGKLANIFDDLKYNALVDTGRFKMLTGNSTLDVELKFLQRRFKLKSYAKMIFSTNKIPPNPNDDSTAFWRRWVILQFTNVFTDERGNRNPDMLKELTTEQELKDLLYESVRALQNLLKNGKFSYEQSIEETRIVWTHDTLADFVNEYVEQAFDGFVSKRELYALFKDYCERNNGIFYDERAFNMKLSQVVVVREGKKRIEGVETRGFYGIRLKQKSENQSQLGEQDAES